jgi:transposase
MYTNQGRTRFAVRTAQGTATLQRRYYGPHPIIEHYLRRIGLADIIEDCLGNGSYSADTRAITHADVVRLLVHNIIVSAVPLYRIGQWASSVEPTAIGMTTEQHAAINDDRIARTLDTLGTERARNLFFRLALRVMKDFAIVAQRIHFDTTTVTFRGDYSRCSNQPAIARGHNKDGHPELKQLVFGLSVTADGAVPLQHGVYSGNRNDDTLHENTIDRLRSLLSRSDFVYVADSKLCSADNLAHIAGGGGKFVSVYPAGRKEVKAFLQRLRDGPAVRWSLLAAEEQAGGHVRPQRYYRCPDSEQLTAEGYRLLWVRSSYKMSIDRSSREHAIEKAIAQMNALKLNRGRLSTRAQIIKAQSAIVAKYKLKPFLTVHVAHRFQENPQPKRRRRIKRTAQPSHKGQRCLYYLNISRNEAAIKAETRVDGVFPLITNLDTTHHIREVLDIYKYQPYVEKKFALLKSELRVAPMFLKKPSRVAAMLHVYFIAIMVASLIERTVRTAMRQGHIEQLELLPEQRFTKNPTCPRVLEAFTDLCEHVVAQPGNQPLLFPLALTEQQKMLLHLLDVPESTYR